MPSEAVLRHGWSHYLKGTVMTELSICDQIVLLGLGEDGVLDRPYDSRLDYAIAGASLLDLSFQNRIDTDPSRLFIISADPTGDPLLDSVLHQINSGPPNQPISYWITEIARYALVLRQQIIEDLADRKIIHREAGRRLIVLKTEKFPPTDPQVVRDVERKLIDTLLSDEIPDPDTVALIGLARASRLIELLLPRDQLERVEPRLEQLARMDLIGMSVNRTLDEIQAAVALAVALAVPRL